MEILMQFWLVVDQSLDEILERRQITSLFITKYIINQTSVVLPVITDI